MKKYVAISRPIVCVETGIIYPCRKAAHRALKTENLDVALKDPDKTSAGYHWRYADERDFACVYGEKMIQCVETEEVFTSIKAAARAIGVEKQSMQYTLRDNEKRTCKGYHWTYYNGPGINPPIDKIPLSVKAKAKMEKIKKEALNMCENKTSELCEMDSAEYEEEMRQIDEYLKEVDGKSLKPYQKALGILRETVGDLELDEKENLISMILGSMDAKSRVVFEAKEAGTRFEALHAYLKGYNKNGVRNIVADGLTDAMVYLMQKQETAMADYYNALVSRLSIWDVKVDVEMPVESEEEVKEQAEKEAGEESVVLEEKEVSETEKENK